MVTTIADDHSAELLSVLVQPGDGKIVAAGSCGYDDITGIPTLPWHVTIQMAAWIQVSASDGWQTYRSVAMATPSARTCCCSRMAAIVVAGYTYTDYPARKYDFSLAKFTADGSLDLC